MRQHGPEICPSMHCEWAGADGSYIADSKVHQNCRFHSDYCPDAEDSDACSDLPQEKVNTVARDCRGPGDAFESKHRLCQGTGGRRLTAAGLKSVY